MYVVKKAHTVKYHEHRTSFQKSVDIYNVSRNRRSTTSRIFFSDR